jgi:hypothetical protein
MGWAQQMRNKRAQQTLPMTTNYHIMNEFDMTCAAGRAIAERSVSAVKGALKGP